MNKPREVYCCEGCGRDTTHSTRLCSHCRIHGVGQAEEYRGDGSSGGIFRCTTCNKLIGLGLDSLSFSGVAYCERCGCQLSSEIEYNEDVGE